ncbi:MAG: hypothetical protein U0694_01775 [Anaerolineae bacterium]
MLTEPTITIPVDSELAERYNDAPPEIKAKIVQALNIRLREVVESEAETLEQVMRRVSRNAQARGLTPEILNEILSDDES